MSWSSLATRLALRSIGRPMLGVALVRIAWRFRTRRWYLRFPFLPLPDREYVRWRMETAYGEAGFIPSTDDVERYARWAVKS